jgi:hypothetical protein
MTTELILRTAKAITFAIMLLVVSETVAGQDGQMPLPKTPDPVPIAQINRPVTVFLKVDDPLKGTLVSASAEGIQLLLAGNTLTLKWIDITQLVFTDVVSEEALKKPDPLLEPKRVETTKNEAVENSLRSLRKLAAAAEVGVNFEEYGRRLIDVKSEVSELLPKIEEGAVKEHIILAMDAYVDASTAWNRMIRNDILLADFEPGSTLRTKYSIPSESSKATRRQFMRRNVVLSTIWGVARQHIKNAEAAATPK